MLDLLLGAKTPEPGYSLWAGIVLPSASILISLGLGVTAFILALFSYNTARRATAASERANELVLTARTEDKEEAAAAWRRRFGFKVRDWYLSELIESWTDYDNRGADLQPIRALEREAQIEGVESGAVLARYYQRELEAVRDRIDKMTDEERDSMTTNKWIEDTLSGYAVAVDEWIAYPPMIDIRWKNQIRLAALLRRLENVGG